MEEKRIDCAALLQKITTIKKCIEDMEVENKEEVIELLDIVSNCLVKYSNVFMSFGNDLENLAYSIPYYPKKRSSKAIRTVVDKMKDSI